VRCAGAVLHTAATNTAADISMRLEAVVKLHHRVLECASGGSLFAGQCAVIVATGRGRAGCAVVCSTAGVCVAALTLATAPARGEWLASRSDHFIYWYILNSSGPQNRCGH
jgi:hypothetical protein